MNTNGDLSFQDRWRAVFSWFSKIGTEDKVQVWGWIAIIVGVVVGAIFNSQVAGLMQDALGDMWGSILSVAWAIALVILFLVALNKMKNILSKYRVR